MKKDIKELKSSPHTRIVVPTQQKGKPRSRRSLYALFAGQGLHLTLHFLKIAEGFFAQATRPTVAKCVRRYPKLNGCTDPARGVFNNKMPRERTIVLERRPVIAKSVQTGKRKKYPSIYLAAVTDFNGKVSSISHALGSAKGTFAGYKWRYA